MTPDDRQPRKRRRRRRRGGAPGAPETNGGGNGNVAPNGNQQQNDRFTGPGAGRRRRGRHRKGRGDAPMTRDVGAGGGPAVDVPPGELAQVKGVLFIKPSGTAILVAAATNFVPQQGYPIVPPSTIERLHLDPGLEIAGTA